MILFYDDSRSIIACLYEAVNIISDVEFNIRAIIILSGRYIRADENETKKKQLWTKIAAVGRKERLVAKSEGKNSAASD